MYIQQRGFLTPDVVPAPNLQGIDVQVPASNNAPVVSQGVDMIDLERLPSHGSSLVLESPAASPQHNIPGDLATEPAPVNLNRNATILLQPQHNSKSCEGRVEQERDWVQEQPRDDEPQSESAPKLPESTLPPEASNEHEETLHQDLTPGPQGVGDEQKTNEAENTLERVPEAVRESADAEVSDA